MKLRGDEKNAWDWLRTESDHVENVGDGEGQPDFVIEYGGEEVAVEVARMSDGDGWPRDKRIGFERALGRVVQSVREEVGRPVGTCSASTIRGNLVPRHGVVRGRKSLGTSYEMRLGAARSSSFQIASASAGASSSSTYLQETTAVSRA